MKTLQPLLAALAFAFCITSIAQGVEYKTLKTAQTLGTGTPVNSEIDVLSTDIIEVLSSSYSSTVIPQVVFQFKDGSWARQDNATKFQIITGITKFRLLGNSDSGWVTIKITPAEAVAPTTVLVLPEAPGGNYDLLVESSGNLVTWAPFHSQAVLSGGANAFFRVRIVKK